MAEAPVRRSKNGLVVDGDGWFVVNARDSRWRDEGPLGSYCTFEGKKRFPHFGINISVFEPGERMPPDGLTRGVSLEATPHERLDLLLDHPSKRVSARLNRGFITSTTTATATTAAAPGKPATATTRT